MEVHQDLFEEETGEKEERIKGIKFIKLILKKKRIREWRSSRSVSIEVTDDKQEGRKIIKLILKKTVIKKKEFKNKGPSSSV